MSFGNQFLHHDIQHGACREGEQPGHQRFYGARHQYGEDTKDWFYNTRHTAAEECLSGRETFLTQRKGDCRTLREILNTNTDGESHGCGIERRIIAVLCSQCKGQANRHAFRYVVQRNRHD